MTTDYSQTVNTARDYYNSSDADNFYFNIWGGEDIHIGIYEYDEEDITAASRRTVERIAARLKKLDRDTRVLDLGAGYGGAARYLARNYGCQVVALNLSEVENERNRQKNREQGLGHLVEVVDGNFEKIPFPDESFDVVWSQDAILHSGERTRVLEEVARVLKPGGEFVFTDPMQADDCPDGVLDPILERIHLDTLGSPAFYRETADRLGVEEVHFEPHTNQLVNHYARVLEETRNREQELADAVSPKYIERMKRGLKNWVEGGRQGHLTWGIFHFEKTNGNA
jgi:sarcosine/dimethylglycine N-methyltransferase